MGIKGFNAFLKKKVNVVQLQRLRQKLTEIASLFPVDHQIRTFIEQNVIPLKATEEVLEQMKLVVEALRPMNLMQTNELMRVITMELPLIAAYDPLHKRIPLSGLRGKRLALDANNWMFMHISVAHRRTVGATDVMVEEVDRALTVRMWLTKLLDDVCLYLTYGVTPVFVFDGEYPIEKKLTKEKRVEKKVNVRERIGELRTALDETDILERTDEMVSEYKKLLCQNTYVSREEVDLMKQVLEGLGIPWIQARCEGEKLCTILAIEGKVAAVFSNDTDNLTYGCPCLLTHFEGQVEGSHALLSTGIKDILELLEIPYQTFVDLCIMSGCDYNENIKNLGIGKAYKLLQQHQSIDCLPAKHDTTILNHKRCRELFAYTNSTGLISTGYMNVQPERLQEGARDILTGVQLSHYLYKLVPLYQKLPPPQDIDMRPPSRPKLTILD